MAIAEIQRFADAVRQDATLQADLMGLEDVDALIAHAVQLARAHSYYFTAAEVRACLVERLNTKRTHATLNGQAVG